MFPLQNASGETVWMMIVSLGEGGPNGGSGTQYFLGDFDGITFTNANSADKILWLDYGRDNYAGVTWSDIPSADGRRIFLGWMSNWQYAQLVPTERWRSAMTAPRSLALANTELGTRVLSYPVSEILTAFQPIKNWEAQSLLDGDSIQLQVAFEPGIAKLDLSINSLGTGDLLIECSNSWGEQLIIGFNAQENQFLVDRNQSGKVDFSEKFAGVHKAPRISTAATVELNMLFDVASLELFADGGEVVMTEIMFPQQPYDRISIKAIGGDFEINSLVLSDLP